jgi:hypothetical protein
MWATAPVNWLRGLIEEILMAYLTVRWLAAKLSLRLNDAKDEKITYLCDFDEEISCVLA